MARGQKKEKKELTPEERLQNALVPKEEWPYELPEEWKWVRLGDVALNQYGYTTKANEDHNLPQILRITDIQNNFVDWATVPHCNISDEDFEKYHLEKGDIVIARTGATTGKSFLIAEERNSVYASYLIRLRAIRTINVEYLYLFLHSDLYWNQITDLSQGIAQPGVNSSKLKTILFPLAPRDLQDKITDFVSLEFHRLDEAKDQIQSVLDSSEERKQSILYKAFTGELTEKWRKENGVPLDSWHKEKIKSVCDINPKKEDVSGYDDDMEVSFFPMASLDERVGAITDPQIRPLKEVKKGFTNFREGDVVFAKITPCMENGKSAVIGRLVNDIGYGTTEFYVFRCGKQIDKYYLFHLLRSKKFRNDAKQEMTGAVGQQRVPKKYLEDYEVNLPGIDEQEEIVRLLDSFIEKEDEIAEASDQIMSNLEDNKKSILSKAFRGELHL